MRSTGGIRIASPIRPPVPPEEEVIVEPSSDSEMEIEAPSIPRDSKAPELQLPSLGASHPPPPRVMVTEGGEQAAGSSELITHRSARYPKGLFVDPDVFHAARNVLGRVERQQISYAEAARRTAEQLLRKEEFIAQQRRELDEARLDLLHARELAQGNLVAAGGPPAAVEQLRQLLETERASHQRELALLEGQRRSREDSFNEQLGMLEDRIHDHEDTIDEYMATIQDLKASATTHAREAEAAAQAALSREEDLQAQLREARGELAGAKKAFQDADLRASEGEVRASRLQRELADNNTEANVAACRHDREQQLFASKLQRVATLMEAAMPSLGIEMPPADDTSTGSLFDFVVGAIGRLEALPLVFDQAMKRSVDAAVTAAANTVLPRVYHLAPEFPFARLFEDYEEDADHRAALAAAAPIIEELLRRLRRV